MWTGPDGLEFAVPRSALPCILVETSLGEFDICEACYLGGLPEFFLPEDVAEVHYQFGLDYTQRQQYVLGVEALRRARQILESADILASLGYAEDLSGNREVARGQYRRALEIEPGHFIAGMNLRQLDGGFA